MTDLRTARAARVTLAAVIVALTVASAAYRLLVATSLEHTSLLFIGIPALLALGVIAIQPRTTAGTIHKTIALALCVSGIMFGEGFICILMAAPLFFGVGALVAHYARKDEDRNDGIGASKVGRLGIFMLLPMSLEGVIPHFELEREHTVRVSRVVNATSDEVHAALAAPMRFDAALPTFFKLGFPTPGATSGSGLAVGDVRTVEFLHGGHHPGVLRLEVTESGARQVVFSATNDDSYLTHWLSWRTARVSWREVAPGQTEVVWTLHYWRRLDPAWYFAPLERYGVSLAAGYLIETVATPRGARRR